MRIFTELEIMQKRMLLSDWEGFSKRYFSQCNSHDPVLADQIHRANLDTYRDAVSDAFESALKISIDQKCEAIYFEYDLDNSWNSSFFTCPDYNPLDFDDDDWACEFNNVIPAGSQLLFANIYDDTDNFCSTDAATDTTLYLIARTTELLNNVVTGHKLLGTNICLGFHDQNPIHRLKSAG